MNKTEKEETYLLRMLLKHERYCHRRHIERRYAYLQGSPPYISTLCSTHNADTYTEQQALEIDKLYPCRLERVAYKMVDCEFCKGAGQVKKRAPPPEVFWPNLDKDNKFMLHGDVYQVVLVNGRKGYTSAAALEGLGENIFSCEVYFNHRDTQVRVVK